MLAPTPYDYLLIIAVTFQAALVSYLYKPHLKALFFMLPIPFTCVALAVGKPIDVSNIAGLFLLLGYMFLVLALRTRLRLPIIPAILASALAYCLAGAFIQPYIPQGPIHLVGSLLTAALVAFLILRQMPPRTEPGERSALPLYLKLPILAATILALITIKSLLGGMLTLFPIMGMISAYEAKHSLYTLTRHVPILILLFVPTLATIIIAQNFLPLPAALLTGWATYLTLMLPFATLPRPVPTHP